MLILGIDTSGKSGGIALAEGDGRTFRLLGSSPIAGGTFSAQLVPTIGELLAQHGRTIQELSGFAVASGPGSFTGLRVGLSAVKGLAEVLEKPIAAVSLLEALAISPAVTGGVGAALDAGRSEVFWGVYQIAADSTIRSSEDLLSQAEFLEKLRDNSLAAAILGDQTLADLVAAKQPQARTQLRSRPSAEDIARIGLRKLRAGETVSVLDLDANYIRRSDAELFSKGPR